ncbi:MAG: hypothetical protein OEW83_14245 [Acidimicrobiia bacterium]|nr:hypothetical protein [Acidimicrobiia bacterium]
MRSVPSETSTDIVVGFADRRSSSEALERAIAHVADNGNARLVVVHASSSPITVRNGPTAQIAQAIGAPGWATVHTTVLELGADPARTLTVIEPGEPVSVIARHCTSASVVYVGRSRRRRLGRAKGIGQRLGTVVACPVVQVAADDEPRSPSSSSPVNRFLPAQTGATSWI